MSTLLIGRKLWLAIPEGGTARQCVTYAPRKSWKPMVEFFMVLSSNLKSWIRNLERRDMMLLTSLGESLFGFTGTYAREKQANLAPILTGWKRWVKIHPNKERRTVHRKDWLQNLQILGSVEINTDTKAVAWNIGPHGYKGSKKAVHQIFEQGPPVMCLQDVRKPNRGKKHIKKELQRLLVYINTSKSPQTNVRDQQYVFSVLTAPHSAHFPKATQMQC